MLILRICFSIALSISITPLCIANSTAEFDCYECTGYYMTETPCLETFPFGVPPEINKTTCSTFCYKTINYMYDKKTYVSRGCAETCEVDCYLSLAEGYCRYCCQDNDCNTATNGRLSYILQILTIISVFLLLLKMC